MTFKFPLQKLLNYRENIEEKKKEKLAVLQDKKKVLEEKLQDTQNKYKTCTNTNPDTKVNISSFGQQLAYMDYLDRSIGEQTTEIQKASFNVEKCLEEVVEAMKNRKILEKLKDKQEVTYYDELNYKELMDLNEVAIRRFFSKEAERKENELKGGGRK